MEKITTIQLSEKTKKKLAKRKIYPRETYEEIIEKLLEDQGPTMEEMFMMADVMKQDKEYSAQEVVKLVKEMRESP